MHWLLPGNLFFANDGVRHVPVPISRPVGENAIMVRILLLLY